MDEFVLHKFLRIWHKSSSSNAIYQMKSAKLSEILSTCYIAQKSSGSLKHSLSSSYNQIKLKIECNSLNISEGICYVHIHLRDMFHMKEYACLSLFLPKALRSTM